MDKSILVQKLKWYFYKLVGEMPKEVLIDIKENQMRFEIYGGMTRLERSIFEVKEKNLFFEVQEQKIMVFAEWLSRDVAGDFKRGNVLVDSIKWDHKEDCLSFIITNK